MAISAVLTLAVACGGEDQRAPATAEDDAASQENAVPEALVGTYTRELTRQDKKEAGASLQEPPNGLPVGTTELTIEPDGVAFAVHADEGDETIQLEVTSDRFEVTGGSYCEDPSGTSNYRWKTTDEQLTITPIDVDCPDRQAVLTGVWMRT